MLREREREREKYILWLRVNHFDNFAQQNPDVLKVYLHVIFHSIHVHTMLHSMSITCSVGVTC